MKAFMTNGTIDFLKKLVEKHTEIPIKLLSNSEGGLAYYEHPKQNIFQSGRTYEVLAEIGQVEDTGYVVMNNIPVREESQPIFEDHFKSSLQNVATVPGFQAFRLLKPARGNTYIVFTQWNSKKDFDHWKSSPEFAAAHSKNTVKLPDYFVERPFVSTYNMYVEEENIEE